MSDNDKEAEMLRKHCEALSEHFDSVQIFVTRHDPSKDGTVAIHYGLGNWYSRYGQVFEWLGKQDEYTRDRIRKDTSET